MQCVIAIPEREVLRRYSDAEGVLTRDVAGVPLLVRLIATAARAGADGFLVIWPPDIDQSIWNRCAESPLLKGVQIQRLIQRFDPEQPAGWAALAPALEEQFLWLPWNLVTKKGALTGFAAWPVQCAAWDVPSLVAKAAPGRARQQSVEGVLITPGTSIAEAERYLVAHSGKPSDGIYSRFNRKLSRPIVRALTHTRITPNMVTVAGLVVAIASALVYSRGSYSSYVVGAILFFLSGLIDEMDGMLARLKFSESAFGTWFEGSVDNATYLLLFGGITAGLYRQYGKAELIWGVILIAGCALSFVILAIQRKAVTAPNRPHEFSARMNRLMETDSNLISRIARQIHIFIKKGVAVHYVLIFTVVGGLPIFLRVAAISANLTWAVASYFIWRFSRNRSAAVQSAI
jgi:phosphatidylglycerophosphate synthase